MPFQSEKQRRYLHANHPEIAQRWEKEYATGGISNHFRKRFAEGRWADPGMSPGQKHDPSPQPGGGGGPPSQSGGKPSILKAPKLGEKTAERMAIAKVEADRFQKEAKRKRPVIKKDYGPHRPGYPGSYMWKSVGDMSKPYRPISDEEHKDFLELENRLMKGTQGGYGPYTDKYTKLPIYPALSKWQKKEFKDWETLAMKGTHGGYGPYTPPVDLGLVEELSTKDYKPSGPSMDEMGQWYDANGNPIDDPNINPEFASMIKPIALSDTQKKEFKPSKMYSTSDMKVAYEKAQNMNANQFKSWANKNGLSGEYIDQLSSALDYNETSVGKVEMIGKDATKMLDLPGLGDDKQELKNAAATLLGMVKSSANKDDWTTKPDVKLSLANDFYKDKEKYKNLGINNQDDLKKFIDVVYTSVTKSQSLAEGGVARKNYFHGGILGINESEEIISDDGNDIELTDYNAAFDEPTGVKSLFQAKDGGRTNYIYGGITHPGGRRGFPGGSGRPGDTGMPEGGSGANYGGPPGGGDKGMTYTAPHSPHLNEEEETRKFAIQEDIRRREEEKYDTKEQKEAEVYGIRKWQEKEKRVTKLTADFIKNNLKRLNATKYYSEKYGDDIIGMLQKGWEVYKSIPTPTLLGIAKELMAEYKLTKEGNALLEEWSDLIGGPPGTNPQAYDDLWLALEKRKAKYRYDDDDTTGDGPEQGVVPVHEEIKEYEGTYAMSPWERIKANQQKRAMLVEKGIIQENPVVDESVTDITMQANSGGLANLFRVKNQ